MTFPELSHAFPIVVQWFSHDCPIFPHDFAMIFPWFRHDFPIRTSQFSPYLTAHLLLGFCSPEECIQPNVPTAGMPRDEQNYGKSPFFNGKITIFHGKIHYFDWAIFKFANCKRLPEANPIALWRIFSDLPGARGDAVTVPPVEMLSQHLVADEVLTAEKRLIVLCHPGPPRS